MLIARHGPALTEAVGDAPAFHACRARKWLAATGRAISLDAVPLPDRKSYAKAPRISTEWLCLNLTAAQRIAEVCPSQLTRSRTANMTIKHNQQIQHNRMTWTTPITPTRALRR